MRLQKRDDLTYFLVNDKGEHCGSLSLAHVNFASEIEQHFCEHRADSLYPKSQYKCDACGLEHGTRAYAGAVNWQCPNELVLGLKGSHKPAHQTYIGFSCARCEKLIHVDSPEFKALYPKYKAEVK